MVLSRTSTGRVILVPTQLRFDRWFLPLAVPLGLGPKNSELWVGAGSLHVKMGWAFAADIPLTSITKAEATNARVYAAGVHFGFGRWLVNGSRKGLVALTIDPPEQAKMWKKSMTVRELWVQRYRPGCARHRLHGKVAGVSRGWRLARVRNQARWRRTNCASTTFPCPGT